MFLKSKEIAYTGILMAIAIILIIVGGYIEGSTLFFLAAASFLAGIVEKNFSIVTAFAFLVGTTLLSVILAPQKLYCATFAAFSFYVIVAEFFERKNDSVLSKTQRTAVWGIKAVVYHVLLLVSLFLFQHFFGFDDFFKQKWIAKLREYQVFLVIVTVLAAEAVWLLFDKAYLYFRRRYSRYFRLRE